MERLLWQNNELNWWGAAHITYNQFNNNNNKKTMEAKKIKSNPSKMNNLCIEMRAAYISVIALNSQRLESFFFSVTTQSALVIQMKD